MSKGKIEVVKGDLFSWNGNLAHGINCHGAMGAGIAKIFKKQFPDMYYAYKASCQDRVIIPGDCWTWREIGQPKYTKQGTLGEDNFYIFNLAVKDHWSMKATYSAIESSINNLVDEMKRKGVKSVAMPWVGCGLGGLSINRVKLILEKAVEPTDLLFVVYEL